MQRGHSSLKIANRLLHDGNLKQSEKIVQAVSVVQNFHRYVPSVVLNIFLKKADFLFLMEVIIGGMIIPWHNGGNHGRDKRKDADGKDPVL